MTFTVPLRSQNLRFLSWRMKFFLLLLVSYGDIELNPGPIKFPCGVCEKSVRSSQRGILCGSCNTWFHIQCQRISVALYNQLGTDSFPWTCGKCTLPPLTDSFFVPSFGSQRSSMDDQSSSSDFSSSFDFSSESNSSDCLTLQPLVHELCNFTSGHSGYSVAHLNINGLLSKMDYVSLLLSVCDLDVLTLSETKVDHSITDSELTVSGYRLMRKDRTRHGGGVAIYASNRRNCTLCLHVLPQPSPELESISVEFHAKSSRRTVIPCCYRPPSGSISLFANRLSELVENSYQLSSDILVLGDLNINFGGPIPQ